MDELYREIYEPGLYRDVWYVLDGKPMLMAKRSWAPNSTIKNFFTFRSGVAEYTATETAANQWGWLSTFPQAYFRNDKGELLGSTPLINSLIVLIAALFFIPAVAYGKTVGTFKNDKDIAGAMAKSMADMGSFLALAFVSAQFINYFSYTKLGTILALAGADALKSANIGLIPLIVIFVLFTAFMNLFMGSASAKWNIMAPVFVPMFMLLGYSPELCQLAYRVGDSCTNIITPLMTYYAVIIIFAQKYDKKAGIGTVTATMLPYSICFLVCWSIMLILWLTAGLPIGIATSLFYPA
jgi:aminobenzoyl-glutamate transport protein